MWNFFKNLRKKRKYEYQIIHNYNDAIIYPTKEGWEFIREHFESDFDPNYVKEHTTRDGGYKEQLWIIISELHEMFFHGSQYLENSKIRII